MKPALLAHLATQALNALTSRAVSGGALRRPLAEATAMSPEDRREGSREDERIERLMSEFFRRI